ncbi:hypothetical protein [Nocardioides flavescens]|uniref:Uncharacterized protein n=1 Tax=Nocardioides flavescens TaxID=2691959 RepID=A0A6L7EYU9_9ACTN|nr:hypothetical protein [Nocardioides flavescens]MXG91306.1 hypothetical protein [Nocardioides flavescens]
MRTATPDIVTLLDPRPGSTVELEPGDRLCLRLRGTLGASRWHLAAHPGNLLPLVQEATEVTFLAFPGGEATVRVERRRPGHATASDVREVRVVVRAA